MHGNAGSAPARRTMRFGDRAHGAGRGQPASFSAMKFATNALFLALLVLTPACEMLGGDKQSTPDINGLLAGITDQQSAEEAKPMLDSAVEKLRIALAGAQATADEGAEATEASANEAAAEGGSMVQTVLAQFGIGPETAGMIDGLLANEAVQGVLGQTLESLKGLLPSM